jgi:3-oxoacyl-[acyl-carrier protein] reductase
MYSSTFFGKKALVTGGSTGIGLEIGLTLKKFGCDVIVTSASGKIGNEEIAKELECLKLDFMDRESISHALDSLDDKGPFNILINNAGVYMPEDILEINDEVWEKTFKINVYGPMIMTRHIAKGMIKLGSGKILNISSIAGVKVKNNSAAYASSKQALIGLTRAAAVDLAKYKILVNAICPGPTKTSMVDRLLNKEAQEKLQQIIPLRRLAKPNEVANLVIFLCSDSNSYITGQDWSIDGGRTVV